MTWTLLQSAIQAATHEHVKQTVSKENATFVQLLGYFLTSFCWFPKAQPNRIIESPHANRSQARLSTVRLANIFGEPTQRCK